MSVPNIALRFLAALFAVSSVSLGSVGNSMRAEGWLEKRIVRLLEYRYRSERTMQATFLERYAENKHTVRVETGIAYFRRPGKMRWEYESPEKNLFLVDGKTAWFYVPADHTVTRVPAKESGDWRTPLSLLAGEAKLSRVCAWVKLSSTITPEYPDDAVLYCRPRGKEEHINDHQTSLDPTGTEQGDAIFLEVGSDSGELGRVVARGKGGMEDEFRFTDWRIDPS